MYTYLTWDGLDSIKTVTINKNADTATLIIRTRIHWNTTKPHSIFFLQSTAI